MAEDLMSTQTGGYGETIQSAPEATPTPEQFNVQLPPAEQTQQTAPETTPQPTPPSQEGVPTENVTAQVDVAQQDIPQEPPVTPEQPPIQEQPPLDVAESEVKFSGMTSDGEVIFDPSQVKAVEDKPLDFDDQLEYTEKSPTQTEDGEVILGMGPQDESEAVNEVYSGSNVKLRGSRVISFKQDGDPDKPKKPKSDGFYRYAGQPDSIYKKSNGDWYKSTDGGDNYFKIAKGDVDRRIDILEAEATKYSNPTAKASALATKMVGNLGKFNLPNQMVTAGGSTTVAKNISFDDLVKPNVGTETDRYNKDGTLNFNYNAKVATMAPENKAIYDASKKADGLYKFSGREDALYKKEGANWYIDLSGTGDKFEWIDSETPEGKKRIQTLQSQAVPAATYATLKTVLTKVPDASTLGKIQNPFELIDVSNEINTLNQIVESDQLKSVFDQGKNFVDTEIMNFTKDNLTKDQKENLIALQADINEIIGDGSYSDLKAKKVAELLANGQQFFDDAVAINEKVNRAYSAGISIDRLNYENKKKTFAQDFDQKTSSEADMYAAKLFQDVRWMSDFVLENVDAGNLKINPETGAFTFTENASEAERKYIDTKLSEYLKRYEGIQSQRFAEVKDKIYEDKAKLSDIRANIEVLNDQLEQARRSGDTGWASQISGAIKLEKQKISALQKSISDNENMSNTLFLTNPKKVVQSVAGLETASSRAAFEATPKGLTPKQRFDLYYENLQKKNQEIAKRNNINYASLDRFDMRLKDLLDYDDFYSLSDAEQEFLKNKATLNALKSLYYNNDTGYTGSTAGFWNSFVNGYARALQPKTSAADGYQSEKEKLKVVDMAIEEIGFADEDFVTPDAVEKIKEQSVIDFWSKESLGSMVGTSGAYMQMITLASETPGFALKVLANGEKLITGAKTITQAEKYAQGLVKAYDAALDTTKFGRFIKAPIQEGINFQLASEEFNDPDNQLNFLSGLSGGVFGEGFAAIAQKMGAAKAGNYIASIFGNQTDAAVKTLTRVGKMASRGFGELPSETGEELANIYMSSDNFQQMMEKASESYGSFDKIQQFVISTLILGTAFGVASPKSSKEAYNSMPEDKRKQVNALLADLKSDMNKGQQAANNYAETMLNREDSKTKAEENDKENKPRVSGEERVGEKPVETQLVDESGKEAPSPSGVVQEEPGKTEEVTPVEPSGKTGELKSDEDVASKINQAVEENAGLKDVLMSLIGYDPSAKGPKTSKIAQPKGFDSEEIAFLYNEAKADGSNPELVKAIEDIIMPTTQQMSYADALNELQTIKDIKNPTAKRKAIEEFDAKYDGQYKRMSKIDTNFGSIVRNLKKNNLINIDC